MAESTEEELIRASERDRIIQAARNVSREMGENGASLEEQRPWRGLAGWIRAGCPAQPDVRGDVAHPDAATLRKQIVMAVIARLATANPDRIADGVMAVLAEHGVSTLLSPSVSGEEVGDE